jgi:hypothetical protein
VRLATWFSGVFCAYVIAARAVLAALNAGMISQTLEPAASLFISGLMFVFRPAYPLLKPIGLLEGQYWKLPSTGGFILATLLYCLFFLAAGLLFDKIRTGTPVSR